MAWIVGLFAVIANPAAQSANRGLDGLIDSVLRSGHDGRLPPHLSLVLGIGAGDVPLEVRQAVVRNGPEVRAFNVCVANHGDIVILRTNEATQNTKAFLLSTTGKLRSAVSYHTGGQARHIPAAEAGIAAADEVKFWTLPAQHAPER
jgi:hypothetical protein